MAAELRRGDWCEIKMQDVGFGGAKRNGNPQQCNLLESLEVSLVLFVHNLDPFRCVNACVGSLHLGQTCATCAHGNPKQPKGAERAEFQMSERAFYKSGIVVTLGRGISSARVSVFDFLVHPDLLLFSLKNGSLLLSLFRFN